MDAGMEKKSLDGKDAAEDRAGGNETREARGRIARKPLYTLRPVTTPAKPASRHADSSGDGSANRMAATTPAATTDSATAASATPTLAAAAAAAARAAATTPLAPPTATAAAATPSGADPCIRAEAEDDDGYDPYSDRQAPNPFFERDPWS